MYIVELEREKKTQRARSNQRKRGAAQKRNTHIARGISIYKL